jgi:glycosyltransferase involved in cell wall biosynthesis
MHLHFVQSLETLQGAGLGSSALSLHLALHKNHPQASRLLSTRDRDFKSSWPGVIQGLRQGPGKFFYAPELKETARDVLRQTDFFHAHGLYVWLNWWLGAEAIRRKKPLIYHPHGFFDPWILKRSKKKKLLANWLFENRNIIYTHCWRAVTAKEADQIKRVVGPKAKIHIIPNGINIKEIDQDDRVDILTEEQAVRLSYMRKRPRLLLFLSRIHPKKGLDLLIPAWAQLSPNFPDWELLIVGPDEAGYQATVEKLIAMTGCSETCSIHPPVSGAEKRNLFRSADLFVLPSYSEGFPMAVLEAAAHRLPVVQTIECNFPELTAAGGGWQCHADQDDLQRVLCRALSSDGPELSERGALGRTLVAEDYSWDLIAAAVDDLCLSLRK